MNKQKNKQPDNGAGMPLSADMPPAGYSAIWAMEKLNRGQALSFQELERLEKEDPPLYARAQELTRRRETYMQKLLHSKAAGELHRSTTEKLGREVARAKGAEELQQLRWRLMAAQDCYRAITKNEQDEKKVDLPRREEKNVEALQYSGVPTAEQLAVLMRASASDALYSARQMDKLLENILGGDAQKK